MARKYEYDAYVHYPYDGGIKDEKTGCQLFFSIFIVQMSTVIFILSLWMTDGDLFIYFNIYDESGEPIGLATVNRLVTAINMLRQKF